MPNVIQIKHTLTEGRLPPNGALEQGELGIELSANPRLYVGVPAAVHPSGWRLVTDITREHVNDMLSAVGAGTVRHIATGVGLHGGPITHEGEINLIVPVPIHHGGTGAEDLEHAPFLALIGGEMRGPLLLHHTIHEHEREAVSKSYVDALFRDEDGEGGGRGIRVIQVGTGLTGGPTITTAGEIALRTPVAIAHGGTGATSASAARIALDVVGRAELDNYLHMEQHLPLSIARGGTGGRTAREARENLEIEGIGGGITRLEIGEGLHGGPVIQREGSIALRTPVSIEHGGTSATDRETALDTLGINHAIAIALQGVGGITSITAGAGLKVSGPGVTGDTLTRSGTIAIDNPLDVALGGTGVTSYSALGEALGIGTGSMRITIHAGPGIEFDPPGTITASSLARIALEVPVGIHHGGTGGTDREEARENLEAVGPEPTASGSFLRTHQRTWVEGLAAPTSDNTSFGMNANEDRGNSNTAIGYHSLHQHATGRQNTALGSWTLYANTSGTNNVALGESALVKSTTGNDNCACGYSAMGNKASGHNNCAFGSMAGHYFGDGDEATTLNNSVMLGYNCRPRGNNETNQIVIGHNATGHGSNTVRLGNTSITATHCSGKFELGEPVGPEVSGSGHLNISGRYHRNGVPISDITEPSEEGHFLRTHTGAWVAGVPAPMTSNTPFGLNALDSSAGFYNTAVGNDAFRVPNGHYNTAIGHGAGWYFGTNGTVATTTNNSVFIGANSRAHGNNQTNQIVIGHDAVGHGSNTIRLGNEAITACHCSGKLELGAPTGPEVTGLGDINISGQYFRNGEPLSTGVGEGEFLPIRGGSLTIMTDRRHPDNSFVDGLGLVIRNDRIASPEPAMHFINNSPIARGGLVVDNFGAHGIMVNSPFGRAVHVELSTTGGGAAYSAVAHTVNGLTLMLRTTVDAPSGTQTPTLEVSRGVVVGNPFGGDLGVGRINCEDGYFVNGTRLLDDGSY